MTSFPHRARNRCRAKGTCLGGSDCRFFSQRALDASGLQFRETGVRNYSADTNPRALFKFRPEPICALGRPYISAALNRKVANCYLPIDIHRRAIRKALKLLGTHVLSVRDKVDGVR
jgi:hypothetical protein